MKNILNLTLVLALTAGASNAAISVLDTGSFAINTGGTFTDTQMGGLDFTGASKLVVTVGIKSNSVTAGAADAFSVTYNGTAMNYAIAYGGATGTGGAVGIYYLDNPGAVGVGDLVFSYTGAYSYGASAVVLGGTVSGVVSSNLYSGSNLSGNVTATVGSSIIIGAMANRATGATSSSGFTQELFLTGSVGSGQHGSGYITGTTASTNYAFSWNQNSPTAATVGAEFAAIPEPSTALLGGLGLLALLRRRR